MSPRNKFGARPTVVDGIRFASQAEARRYQVLRLMERGQVISNLRCHPRWDIVINGEKVCAYEADFSYWHRGESRQVVEDVKGMVTPVFRLKKKLMAAVHGIDVVEVSAKSPRLEQKGIVTHG